VFFGQGGNLDHNFSGHHGPGWVVGISKQDRFGLWGNSLFNRLGRYLEIIRYIGWDSHRNATGEAHFRGIGHKTGFRDNHFVAGVQDGRHRQIKGFTNPNRNQNLGVSIILNLVAFVQVAAQSCPQFNRTAVGSILGFALIQGINPRL
jgi:hypothetical protein